MTEPSYKELFDKCCVRSYHIKRNQHNYHIYEFIKHTTEARRLKIVQIFLD